MTAAAFTKGFLDLVGDLTPILVSMVTTSKTAQELLDEPIPKESREMVKKKIDALLHIKMPDIQALFRNDTNALPKPAGGVSSTTGAANSTSTTALSVEAAEHFVHSYMLPGQPYLKGLAKVVFAILEDHHGPFVLLRRLMTQMQIFIDRVQGSIETDDEKHSDSSESDVDVREDGAAREVPRGPGPRGRRKFEARDYRAVGKRQSEIFVCPILLCTLPTTY